MKNVFKIVKKELDKIFKFPRTILTTLVLPGFILFAIYTAIGLSMGSASEGVEMNSIIHVINSPESLKEVYGEAAGLKVDLIESNANELEDLKQAILDGRIQAILLYEENFDVNISNEPLPVVKILFDSSAPNVNEVTERAQAIIAFHEQKIYKELGINPNIFIVRPEKVEADEKFAATIIAMILPMILMSFIFASALGIGSDAIAGEKERGTLATLLMLPIKRSEIIIGKIISTSTLTVLSAISSFIGLVASFPFAKKMFEMEGVGSSVSYGALEIIGLVVILLLIALIASTILLIISTFAKNIKEATSMAMPIYIAAIIVPILTMFSSGGAPSRGLYLIPLYNTILGIKDILSLNFNLINFLLTLGSSIIYIGIFVFVLVRMFKSERVLYSK